MENDPLFKFDPVHRPCCCRDCVADRLFRLIEDLENEYGPDELTEPATETIQ